MNAFQIKCYLFPENVVRVSAERTGEANEIRRFALTSTPFGLYQQLIEKIQAAYGDLLPVRDEIRTYWVDEESELVGFSTDSEMQYAIDLQTAVRVSKPYESSSSNSFAVFKVYVARRGAKEASENVSEPQLHPGIVCDGCNGAVVGIRYKCTVCKDYDLCQACEAKGVHKEHAFAKISRPGGRCPFSGRHRYGMFGNRCRRAGGNMPTSQSFQETMNNFVPLITNNIPIVNDPEQLKNFGEFMKQFLDPFGIDVDYYVSKAAESAAGKKDEAKKSEEESSASTSTNAAATAPTAESTAEKTDLLTGSKIEDKTHEQKQHEAASMLSPESIFIPVISAIASNGKETPMSVDTRSPFEVAADALKLKIDENAKVAAGGVEEDSGFNLIDIEKELRYINSIEQLKLMGYNDEGGWLTRLVIAKDGNINAVLDALNPSHK
jgi:sequestosome 1